MNPLQIEISARLDETGSSIRAFAESIGIPKSTLQRKLAGDSEFTLREVAMISSALGYQTSSSFMKAAEERAAALVAELQDLTTRAAPSTFSSAGPCEVVPVGIISVLPCGWGIRKPAPMYVRVA